jgi:DnaK suppressor protein
MVIENRYEPRKRLIRGARQKTGALPGNLIGFSPWPDGRGDCRPVSDTEATSKPAFPAYRRTPADSLGRRLKVRNAQNKAIERGLTPMPETTSFSLHGIEPYTLKKGEEYMNEKQREHFKKLLLAWKRELMEEVDRTMSHLKDEAANFPDPADRASQEEEFSLELRTRDRERKLIKKIDKTLELIESDNYGYCDACGVEIGIRRLEARPTATLCVDCKTIDEIKEKQVMG